MNIENYYFKDLDIEYAPNIKHFFFNINEIKNHAKLRIGSIENNRLSINRLDILPFFKIQEKQSGLLPSVILKKQPKTIRELLYSYQTYYKNETITFISSTELIMLLL